VPEPRAIIFDLDDTLYPFHTFVKSGFAAIAARLESERGILREDALRVLSLTHGGPERGRELQALCRYFSLSGACIPDLIATFRAHRPDIQLPSASRDVLIAMRATWRVGILTNGIPAVQRRKSDALHIEPLVDAVVCAEETGTGARKPEQAAFEHVLGRLGVRADRAVFVGDDPVADIDGAARCGLRTVHLGLGDSTWPPARRQPDVKLTSIRDVPRAAESLMETNTDSEAEDVA